MLIVGLAGGVASGKTFVAEEFRRLGAKVIDADRLGHQVLATDPVKSNVISEFGTEICDPLGGIDRRKLAKLVFGRDPENCRRLKRLEQLTHPEIEKLLRQDLRDFKEKKVPVVILDAAVMFKSGWNQFCDKILFVECDEPIRLQRALERGWTRESFYAREASQTPIAEKKRLSTDLIINQGQLSPSLSEQVKLLWESWLQPATPSQENR